MPYFHNEHVNLLFIHIPKTGGSTIELYLSYKYNIPLQNSKSLHMFLDYEIPDFPKEISLQHQTLNVIYKFRKELNVDFNNLKIFAVVRNPYERLFSDLKFYKLFNKEYSKETTYKVIKNYLNMSLDNHNIPQYLFIENDHNLNINIEIDILKFENLNKEMERIGYHDFKNFEIVNVSKEHIDFRDYLNEKSLKLINKFYEKDFIKFGYQMI
jgi:hypothetical protein